MKMAINVEVRVQEETIATGRAIVSAVINDEMIRTSIAGQANGQELLTAVVHIVRHIKEAIDMDDQMFAIAFQSIWEEEVTDEQADS